MDRTNPEFTSWSRLADSPEGVRDPIRRDQQAKERLAILRRVLSDGESSGAPKPLDIAAIKAAGRKMMNAAN